MALCLFVAAAACVSKTSLALAYALRMVCGRVLPPGLGLCALPRVRWMGGFVAAQPPSPSPLCVCPCCAVRWRGLALLPSPVLMLLRKSSARSAGAHLRGHFLSTGIATFANLTTVTSTFTVDNCPQVCLFSFSLLMSGPGILALFVHNAAGSCFDSASKRCSRPASLLDCLWSHSSESSPRIRQISPECDHWLPLLVQLASLGNLFRLNTAGAITITVGPAFLVCVCLRACNTSCGAFVHPFTLRLRRSPPYSAGYAQLCL